MRPTRMSTFAKSSNVISSLIGACFIINPLNYSTCLTADTSKSLLQLELTCPKRVSTQALSRHTILHMNDRFYQQKKFLMGCVDFLLMPLVLPQMGQNSSPPAAARCSKEGCSVAPQPNIPLSLKLPDSQRLSGGRIAESINKNFTTPF